jgi:hypothetical protein
MGLACFIIHVQALDRILQFACRLVLLNLCITCLYKADIFEFVLYYSQKAAISFSARQKLHVLQHGRVTRRPKSSEPMIVY